MNFQSPFSKVPLPLVVDVKATCEAETGLLFSWFRQRSQERLFGLWEQHLGAGDAFLAASVQTAGLAGCWHAG